MLTRKDFKFLAEIISTIKNLNDRIKIASLFSIHLKNDNPRFDRDKFMSACKVMSVK